MWTIRRNPSSIYPSEFVRTRSGWYLVTRRWIIARGPIAYGWR